MTTATSQGEESALDLQQLKTFLEVCQTRHFGHAASNLYLTQSAVSFRIRQLENQLGTTLFVRHRNNLQLTAAGERLQHHAESILSLWEQARQDVASQQDRAATLTLATTPAISTAWLGPALLDMHQTLADRFWRSETLTPDQISRRLLDRSLDLAVLPVSLKVDELTSRLLTPLTLTLTSANGVRTEDAVQRSYVQIDWAAGLPIHPGADLNSMPSLQTSDFQLAINWLQRYSGAAMLPENLVDQTQWQLRADLATTSLPLYLIHHSQHPDLANMNPVIDYLLQR
ncbi:LysR family transcriptional regulator [Saccharospirillum sp. MSK14-1]|uniref:LysR family transcriptional regulator n=1 Tax=Saccharospirillum sp. MSK14-1 TaxID=1897632 RepID=UPI0013048B05|nr:LysR family transcriptional regulator [Saccharospirillum sp. MSK14-1]